MRPASFKCNLLSLIITMQSHVSFLMQNYFQFIIKLNCDSYYLVKNNLKILFYHTIVFYHCYNDLIKTRKELSFLFILKNNKIHTVK